MPVREHVQQSAAADDGQRRCARGEWCKNYVLETQDGRTARAGAPGPRSFCDQDRDYIGECLRDLPGHYEKLGAEIGTPAQAEVPRHVPFGPQVPVREDIDALMRLTASSIAAWAARVRSVARLHQPDPAARHDTHEAVSTACAVLEAHVDALLALQPGWMSRTVSLPPGRRGAAVIPDGVAAVFAGEEIVRAGVDYLTVLTRRDGASAGLEVLHLHYRARSVLGETRAKPDELPGVPCRADGCGLRSLARAEPPSDPSDPGKWSYCLGCGDTMAEDEYREWVALCAAYERNARRVPVLENLPGVA